MSLYFAPYSRDLKKGVRNAKTQYLRRDGVVLKFIDPDGETYFGDAAPLAPFSRETNDENLDYLRNVSLRSLYADYFDRKSITPSLLMALDSCFLLPFYAEQSKNSTVCRLVTDGSESEIVQIISDAFREGFTVFKLKVTNQNINTIISLSRLLAQQFGSRIKLRLDANQELSKADLTEFVNKADLRQLDFFEDPLAVHSDLAHFVGRINLAADEMVNSIDDVLDLLDEGVVDTFVLKPSLLNGVIGFQEIAQLLRIHGKKFVISSLLESEVGLLNLEKLALVLNEDGLVHGIGTGSVFSDEKLVQRNLIQHRDQAPVAVNNWLNSLNFTEIS